MQKLYEGGKSGVYSKYFIKRLASIKSRIVDEQRIILRKN